MKNEICLNRVIQSFYQRSRFCAKKTSGSKSFFLEKKRLARKSFFSKVGAGHRSGTEAERWSGAEVPRANFRKQNLF